MCEDEQTKHFLPIDQLLWIVDELLCYLSQAYKAHYPAWKAYGEVNTKGERFSPSSPQIPLFIPQVFPVLRRISCAWSGIDSSYQQGRLSDETLAQLIQQLAAMVEQAAVTEMIEPAATETLAQTLLTLLQETLEKAQPEIQQELDKESINNIETVSMEVEDGKGIDKQIIDEQIQSQGVTQPGEQAVLPLVGLHQALEQAGAYEKIKKPKNRQVLQDYFTTEAPMGDLRELAGVETYKGVEKIIYRNLQKVFPYLPEDIQEEYKSPKAAIERKSRTQLQTSISKGRIRQGLDKLKQPGKDKAEFSDSHKQHLSEANTRRWQRYHEQKVQSTPQQEAYTVIDFKHLPQNH